MATDDPKQQEVGELEAPASSIGAADENLSVFHLLPAVAPSDSNWDNAPSHGEVVVRARSAADARLVAAESEVDFRDIDALPGDGTTTEFASAFRNPKLYSVVEDTTGRYGDEGQRGLLEKRPDAS